MVANQLSVLQWARTLSRVRLGLQASFCRLNKFSLYSPHRARHQGKHAVLLSQTSRVLHGILPETFAIRLDAKSNQVPSCL